jgi:hypothetical protein
VKVGGGAYQQSISVSAPAALAWRLSGISSGGMAQWRRISSIVWRSSAYRRNGGESGGISVAKISASGSGDGVA